MIKNLLVLPNQLFNQIKEMEVKNIILYEAEEYFTKYNYNQKKLPLPKFDNKELEAAKNYIEKNFGKNPGNLDNFFYPISRKDAKELLADFLQNKFKNFGKYQDAFEKEIIVGFHSLISSILNIGLLNPDEVIESDFFKHKQDFPEQFYQAKSGIEVLNDSINKAVNSSY